MPTDTTTQDLTEEIRGLFDTQIGHTEREGLIQLIQSHTTDTEVRNIIMTGAEALIEQGIKQGIEQGAREATIENMLAVLTERFPHADVNALKPTLEAIADLNRLKQLNLSASLVPSFQAFQHRLEA